MKNRQIIEIASLTTGQIAQINNCLLNLDVEFTLNEASMIKFSVIDPNFEMGRLNYFALGRDVLYTSETISPISDSEITHGEFARLTLVYEIASVQSTHSGGNSCIWEITAFPKGIQQMKRDRHFSNIQGANHNFITNAALKFGLRAVVEHTIKSRQIQQYNGQQQAESLWDAMSSLASNAQYKLFESDGIIYFGSEKWLLGTWGTNKAGGTVVRDSKGKIVIDKVTKKPKRNPLIRYIPFHYPTPATEKYFYLMALPQITRSSNDPYAGSGSMIIDRKNGVRLRPGMTIRISGIPECSGYFIIEKVAFKEFGSEPVEVSFKTPELIKDPVTGRQQQIKDLEVGNTVDAVIDVIAPGITKKLDEKIGKPTISQFKKMLASSSKTHTGPWPSTTGQGVMPTPGFEVSHFLEKGNVDLFTVPIVNKKIIKQSTVSNSEKDNSHPLFSLFLIEENSHFVVLNQNICVDGKPQFISQEDAATLYDTTGLHYGKFDTAVYGHLYIEQLKTSYLNLLKKRFKNTTTINAIQDGNAPSDCRCS
jgi:hypothetical protein